MIIHPAGRFDNKAQAYEHIVVEELAAAMGAEIKGVDLARLTDAQFADIEHALFRHKMIFLRDQASPTPITSRSACASASSPMTPTRRAWRDMSTSSR